MKIIDINTEKCIGCGLCKKDCPAFAISIENKKAVARESGCIECGHCFAICPCNAISMNGYDNDVPERITPMTQIDAKTLLDAMRGRRTVRHFKDIPVEQEKIDMIIEAGRYCPTAANGQKISYTILGSKQDEIEKECVKLFRFGVGVGKNFVDSLKNSEIDDHFFFKKAPLVIVVSGKGDLNASLASSYMELMAESLGLGVLYSGFFVACSRINPKIAKMLNLKKGYKPVNCMIFGYPDVEYKRIVPRKDANITTL